jgi:hypothetical protein
VIPHFNFLGYIETFGKEKTRKLDANCVRRIKVCCENADKGQTGINMQECKAKLFDVG